jgi:antitoxin component YwqK of YwqJK toxin-antitoxin module
MKINIIIMKLVFVLCFFTVSFFQAQEINKLDEKGLKHGLWKGVHAESKRPRYEGTFDHGKEIGTFKFFDDTKAGTLIATREFNTKDNSCYTTFYNQKGFKVSEGKEVNKLYEGEWKYYHLDSDKIMTTEFYTQGKLNGARKVYYKSGKIAEEANYKDGKKQGLYKKYTEDGIVLEQSNFVNGEYEGLAIFRDSDNSIIAKGYYKKGIKKGEWEVLDKNKLVKKNMDKQKPKRFAKRTKSVEKE